MSRRDLQRIEVLTEILAGRRNGCIRSHSSGRTFGPTLAAEALRDRHQNGLPDHPARQITTIFPGDCLLETQQSFADRASTLFKTKVFPGSRWGTNSSCMSLFVASSMNT